MLRDFRTRMGENPVGSNAEIMRALMGGNSAGANLGPPAGQNLSAGGELVDRWGTPYFFHQLGKNSMEIRSAGPDKQMWTADDQILRELPGNHLDHGRVRQHFRIGLPAEEVERRQDQEAQDRRAGTRGVGAD